MAKYIEFKERKAKKDEKPGYTIMSKKSGDALGNIFWYKPWSKYVFMSDYETVWSAGCLKTVQEFMEKLK